MLKLSGSGCLIDFLWFISFIEIINRKHISGKVKKKIPVKTNMTACYSLKNLFAVVINCLFALLMVFVILRYLAFMALLPLTV